MGDPRQHPQSPFRARGDRVLMKPYQASPLIVPERYRKDLGLVVAIGPQIEPSDPIDVGDVVWYYAEGVLKLTIAEGEFLICHEACILAVYEKATAPQMPAGW